MAGKFVVKKGPTGKFRFNLVATNGQIVATSEAYNSKASAMTGIRSVKSLAADAVVEDQTAKAAAGPAKAAASTTKAAGGACGYHTDVALFGGPSERRGCGQTVPPASAASASPAVTLPPGGSNSAVTATDADGIIAQYGPAVVLCGRPKGSNATPPTGAIAVSTKGTTTVSSAASMKNVDAGPFMATSVRTTCSASKSGVKASTSISKGVVVTAADADGTPKASQTVPAKPPPNLTFTGKNTIGDKFKLVFNEQTTAEDGTITVVAVHLYLLGPTAVGDVVVAESHARV